MDDLRPQEAVGPDLHHNHRSPTPSSSPGLWSRTSMPQPPRRTSTGQVRLTDVHPDGRSSWITDGQLRATERAIDPARSRYDAQGDVVRPWYTFAAHQPLPVAKVVEFTVELGPTSNIFRAGDRIRLDIQPLADGYVESVRTGGVGLLQIARGGPYRSSLLVPVIPHRLPAEHRADLPACNAPPTAPAKSASTSRERRADRCCVLPGLFRAPRHPLGV